MVSNGFILPKNSKNDPLTSKTEFPKRPFTCINIKIITPAQGKGTDIKLRVLYECKLLNHNAIDFIFIQNLTFLNCRINVWKCNAIVKKMWDCNLSSIDISQKMGNTCYVKLQG